MLGIAVAFLVTVAVGLVAKAIRPYSVAGAQASQLAETRHQVALLDTQNAELARRIALLNTTGGVITEARKMGYLKPGEIPFVVETSASQDKGIGGGGIRPPAPVPTLPKPHSRLHGLLRRLTGHSF